MCPTVPPRDTDIRHPAEYEPTGAVIMSYEKYEPILLQLAVEIVKADADVWMLNGPILCQSHPILSGRETLDQLECFSTVTSNLLLSTQIPSPLKRIAVIYTLRTQESIPSCSTDLFLDNGNLMSNGAEIFHDYANRRLEQPFVKRSYRRVAKTFLGAKAVHVLLYAKNYEGQPADCTGRIDHFAEIVKLCIVVVAETNDVPYGEPLEEAADYFMSTECSRGTGTNDTVHRVAVRVGRWDLSTSWYTYTKSRIVNNVVTIPSFRDAANDEAMAVYQSALLDSKIASVNTDAPIRAGGSVHCLTRRIPRLCR